MTASTTSGRGEAAVTLEKAPSPHLHDDSGSRTIMLDVLLALVPAVLGSVFFFGYRVIPYYLISVAVAVFLDWVCRKVRGGNRRFDWTPVVTGVLLAMSLPGNVPLWYPVLGAAVAILLAKELFGGTGRNFLNPAVTGRLVLRLLFVNQMTQNIWPRPGVPVPANLDAVTGATPLMIVKEGYAPENIELVASFVGNIGGKIGETSAVLLLIGAVYLLMRRVIRWRIPVTMIVTMAVLALLTGWAMGVTRELPQFVLGHILGGATILAAFYMATDYSSSPSTPSGQVLFAIGIGVFTMIYRIFGEYSEGLTFAIVGMNFLVPLINRYTMPRVVGEKSDADRDESGKAKAGKKEDA